ncbi:MAG TPA: sialate O-acetylesterase [Lysobacter sp.]|nr:sialate O-acetylesterase [Lysobacter sp.]
MFSDGAVVQRDQPLPVWGWATPGAKIEVALDGRSATATAADDGAWRVELPAHGAGGPFELTVREGSGDIVTVRDVLVGDVWLASGQSNMEWPVAQAQDAEKEIAAANDAGIRHFKVPKSWSGQPEARLTGGDWRAASPQTVGQFSAVAYYFARELRARTGVPIGIIDSTWGGSNIETWTDASSLGVDAPTIAAKLREVREADERTLASTRQRIARWPEGAGDASWKDASLDDSDWDTLPVPALWEAAGYTGMDGVAWYRTTFELTAPEAAAGVVLALGMIDDSDEAWVNGQRVGGLTNRWSTPREYRVAPQALREGINHLAVRVTDTGGGGGIHGDAGLVYLQPLGGARRALSASWKFRPASVTVAMQDDKNQIETLLFNQMIHPLQPYPLRGIIWYQGESNANVTGQAYRYRDQFATLIRAWRSDWKQPALPFLWVQLANFRSGADTATHSPWAMLRESQSHALSLPATAQTVAIDIGDPADIHPLNKQEVGRRLALAARHVAYGESLVYSGPVYRTAKFHGGRVRIAFDMQGSALATRGSQAVQGFEVAGDDRHFHPARAVIKGKKVVVSSDAVAQPRAVRYAWSDNPEQANLTNREGLPASPFRTDDWQ